MIQRSQRFRRIVASTTAAVVLALGLGVPLLDSGMALGHVSIAAEQVEGGFGDHDHGICVHHGATTWATGARTAPPLDLAVDENAPAQADAASPDGPAFPTHRSRAPPIS